MDQFRGKNLIIKTVKLIIYGDCVLLFDIHTYRYRLISTFEDVLIWTTMLNLTETFSMTLNLWYRMISEVYLEN